MISKQVIINKARQLDVVREYSWKKREDKKHENPFEKNKNMM